MDTDKKRGIQAPRKAHHLVTGENPRAWPASGVRGLPGVFSANATGEASTGNSPS